MNELQFWEAGEPLSYAAIRFGDPYQTGKWRSAPDSGAIDAYEVLLIADLYARIQEGEFVAFGFMLEPSVSDGPLRIPQHTFEPRPDLTLARSDKLQVSGYSYERIRILPKAAIENENLGKPIVRNIAGRQSTYEKSKTVIELLFLAESNRSKPAAKLHPDFELEFRRIFPLGEWEVAAPSERTLRDHLKRYRQELEEIDPSNIAD